MLNKTKKVAISAIGGSLLIASMAANAIVVGNVDFGALGNNPQNLHFETATLAQTLIDANNQNVTTYGQITTVNGSTNYCVGGCALYYTATFENSAGFTESGGTSVSFDTADLNIFLANAPLGNLLTNPGGSVANLAAIQALTDWAHFTNHGDITGTGNLVGSANIGGSTSGLYDIETGFGVAGVADFLNLNTISNGGGSFADIDITASFSNIPARLNQFDPSVVDGSCFDGSAGEGDWCFGGTADIAGGTVVAVPEPTTLALLGLGLLGFGFRKSK